MSLTHLVFAIIASIITIIGGYLTTVIKQHANVAKLVSALPMLAKQAVIFADALGVKEQITGAVKKSQAIEYVSQQLDKLGVTKADEDMITQAVKTAYEQAKADGLFEDVPEQAEKPAEPVQSQTQAK